MQRNGFLEYHKEIIFQENFSNCYRYLRYRKIEQKRALLAVSESIENSILLFAFASKCKLENIRKIRFFFFADSSETGFINSKSSFIYSQSDRMADSHRWSMHFCFSLNITFRFTRLAVCMRRQEKICLRSVSVTINLK